MIYGFFDSFFGNLVPICGILMPVAIVWIVVSSSRKAQRERNELISKLVEQGKDPQQIMPLLTSKGKKENEKNPTQHFKSGITMSSIGLGLVLVDLISHWGTLGIGAFIGIIGLGEVAVAWYLRKYSK